MATIGNFNDQKPITYSLSTPGKKNAKFGQMEIGNNDIVQAAADSFVERIEGQLRPLFKDNEWPQFREVVRSEFLNAQSMIRMPERKMLPIDEAAKQLGVTDRTVRRIIAEGHAASTRQIVPVQINDQRLSDHQRIRQVEKVFVSFDDLVNYRENRNVGGRPKKQIGIQPTNIPKNRFE